jgi:alanine racemase
MSDVLTEKYVFINEEILRDNYKKLAEYCGFNPAGLLKNNAYGLGMSRVAPILEDMGCEVYFVGHIYEAIELRSILKKTAKIIVLAVLHLNNPKDYIKYDLIPVISSWECLKIYNENLANEELCVNFDTGLNARGFWWQEAQQVREKIKNPCNFESMIVMTHIASAWKFDNSQTIKQRARFQEIMDIFPDAKHSFANTDSLRFGKDYILDVPRIGKGLYGVTFHAKALNVNQCFHVYANIEQVKTVLEDAPETGYGGYVQLSAGTVIGIVNAGNGVANNTGVAFSNQIIWNNKEYPAVFLFLDYMIVDFGKDIPNTGDRVELIFQSSHNPYKAL